MLRCQFIAVILHPETVWNQFFLKKEAFFSYFINILKHVKAHGCHGQESKTHILITGIG